MGHAILVVDDDALIRDSIVELLEDEGYRVLSAINGRDALERLRSLEEEPCLVLLDLMMPVMNGLEFLEQIQKDPALSSTVVVVVSAFTDQMPGQISRFVPPVRDRLQKPVKLSRLLSIVEKHCASTP